jgi:hypothetical protein
VTDELTVVATGGGGGSTVTLLDTLTADQLGDELA